MPVLQIICRVIATLLIKPAGLKRTEVDIGAATLRQPIGSVAHLNLPLHGQALDGVYRLTEGVLVFHATPLLPKSCRPDSAGSQDASCSD